MTRCAGFARGHFVRIPRPSAVGQFDPAGRPAERTGGAGHRTRGDCAFEKRRQLVAPSKGPGSNGGGRRSGCNRRTATVLEARFPSDQRRPRTGWIESEAPGGTEVDFISACTPQPTTADWQTTDALGEAERGLPGALFHHRSLRHPASNAGRQRHQFYWEHDPIPVSSNQGNFSASGPGNSYRRSRATK